MRFVVLVVDFYEWNILTAKLHCTISKKTYFDTDNLCFFRTGANIFLSSSGLVKIGDFGSAVKLKDPMCTTQGEVFNTRGTAGLL